MKKKIKLKLEFVTKKRKDESFLEIAFEKNPFLMKKWTIFQNPTNKIEVLLNTLVINEKNLSQVLILTKKILDQKFFEIINF